MQSFCVTLTPLSAFATPLKGDTLFGQLCWAIRNRFGEAKLNECLKGYAANQPFVVVSDAFPEQYLPLPKLPGSYYDKITDIDRKAIKKRCWLPIDALQHPIKQWLNHAKTATQVVETFNSDSEKLNFTTLSEKHPQPHNSINRQTNTTGENGFAPYSIEQEWFIPGLRWSIFIQLDTARLSADDLSDTLKDIGNIGFGRDASIGLGKFAVIDTKAQILPPQNQANACLTLAPIAPQGLGYNPQRSFYQLFTRFGKHGDIAAHQQGKPFKNPVLLAQTAAVFDVEPPKSGFIGQGLGGNGELSKTLPATVQQAYAPVIGINLKASQ